MNGYLARKFGHMNLPLQVCSSAAGFYIGTLEDGFPFSRESHEYWKNYEEAEEALKNGEWQQREHP